MHFERYEITEDAALRINQAKRDGRRIVATGTTSVRTLESAYDDLTGMVKSGWARTNLFIKPGYTYHGLLSYKGQEIKDFNLSLNLPAGTLDGSFRFNSDYHINVVEPEGSSADIQFHAGFQSIASIADVFNLKDQLEKGQVVGKIDMKNGVLFGRKLTLFDDSVLNLGYAGSRLSWDGAYANGWYDIKSHGMEGT